MSFIPSEHQQNRQRLTEEQLRPYHGKQVAWSLDGTHIVAAGDDIDQVFDALEAAGIDPEQVVFSYVERPGEVFLGGLALPLETTE